MNVSYFPGRQLVFVAIRSSKTEHFLDKRKIVENLNQIDSQRNFVVITTTDSQLAVFYSLPAESSELVSLSFCDTKTGFLFIEGVFHRKIMNRDVFSGFDEQLAIGLLRRYSDVGIDAINELDGIFSGLLVDYQNKKTFFLNDLFGVRPLYYWVQDGNCFIANNLRVLLNTLKLFRINIKPNLKAVAAVLCDGLPLGRDTLFKDVNVIVPGHIGMAEDSGKFDFISNYPEIDRGSLSNREAVEHIRASFTKYFNELGRKLKKPIGLFLSRGKDSRILLSFCELLPEGFEIFNLVYGYSHPDTASVKKIAQKYECKSHFLDLEDFANCFEHNIKSSEACVSSDEFRYLAEYAGYHVDNVMIGYLGDKISGKLATFRHWTQIKKISTLSAILKRFYHGFELSFEKKAISLLPDLKEYVQDVREDWEKEIFRLPYGNIFDKEIFHYIAVIGFRDTLSRFRKTNYHVTPLFPYCDKSIYKAYWHLSEKQLRTRSIHGKVASYEKSREIPSTPSTVFPFGVQTESRLGEIILLMLKARGLWDRITNKKRQMWSFPFKSPVIIPKGHFMADIIDQNCLSEMEYENADKLFFYRLKGLVTFYELFQ